MNKLTLQQRIFVIEKYYKYGNARKVREEWINEYGDKINPPHRDTIYHLRDRFHQNGTVADLPRSGRPRSVRTPKMTDSVVTAITQSPQTSAVRLSAELDISRSSLRRILQENGYKAYHPKLIYCLVQDDAERRLQMCQLFISLFENYPQLFNKIMWSGEASFKLNGMIKRHNCVIYATENPHYEPLNEPGVTVWGALSSDGLLGPYFFNETVTGDNYFEMLNKYVFPQLRDRPDFNTLLFMQDGAPPHYSEKVHDLLDTLPAGWIGRRGTVEWAPRSCDLTPMDFSIWGMMKDRVFKSKPTTLDELQAAIVTEFELINANKVLCRTICNSVLTRMEKCVAQEGHQFELSSS
ncbi:XP_014784835.1PREDICTED: uncharacterized protein LOC106879674 [Octopus vulgaris]|uniref:XP_014784835.1PREDICTED: uncharacterized protein LOC106879674 n=1 Tax=Octopus vulgaris TaxID=6645 RepID=A0AA36FHT4_OCTVU|nr:XP_014784835.1PREDICTED: uncharacterized protein LOC106879674 [Octopus vulgaris]